MNIRVSLLRPICAIWAFTDRIVLGEAVLCGRIRRRAKKDRSLRDSKLEEQIAKRMDTSSVLDNPDLDRFEERERRRVESIESKARTNVVALSLAFALAATLLGAVAGGEALSVRTDESILLGIGCGSLVVGWLYLMWSGFFAFRTLAVRQVYRISPEDEAQLEPELLRATRLFCLTQNQSVILAMTNALAVSFTFIRNGIVMFAIGMILIAISILV